MLQQHVDVLSGVLLWRHAIREFPLNTGYGFADYLLYIDAMAAGVIEAKKEGSTLTGVETHFTQGLDPQPSAQWVRGGNYRRCNSAKRY